MREFLHWRPRSKLHRFRRSGDACRIELVRPRSAQRMWSLGRYLGHRVENVRIGPNAADVGLRQVGSSPGYRGYQINVVVTATLTHSRKIVSVFHVLRTAGG